MTEAFLLQALNRASKVLILISDYIGSDVPVSTAAIAIDADSFGNVQYNCNRNHMVLASKCKQRFSSFRLHASRIDYSKLRRRKPLCRNKVQKFEGIFCS